MEIIPIFSKLLKMILLKESVISELIKQCEKEFQNAEFHKFETVNDVNNIEINKNNGIVYFLVSKKKETEILYVGKSKGNLFRQRVRAHFFGIGKGTHSKNCFIEKYKNENRQNVLLKYIIIENSALRSFIEEIFINRYNKEKKLWNYKKCPKRS